MVSALSTLLARRSFARNAAETAVLLCPFSKRGLCNGVSSGGGGGGEGEPGFTLKAENITHSECKAGVPNDPLQYDVAIVGGGMVGLALACGLSSLPLTKHLKITIVDPNPALALRGYLANDRIPGSRVSTVTPATISFFKDIGAWEHVQQQRHAFFDRMQVWDYTGLGYTRYNAKDVAKDYLGCVVENKVLCNSLLLCLQRADTMKTIFPSRLTTLTFPKMDRTISGISSADDSLEQKRLSHLAKLELSDGQILYSKLVVGADGAKSRVRETAGIKTTGWNYSQNGLICKVEHLKENHCAWQRFLPSGPIALLPIGDNYSNIVWTMNPDDSECHKNMSRKEFVETVNHALNHGYGPHPQSSTLDGFIQKLPWFSADVMSAREPFELPPPRVNNVVSERMAFPLSLMHAHEYASRRVVLIGDAAHTVHPLAGQGVNLGFGDASTLANVISEGLSVGTDVGEIALLKKYEKQRKAANIAMMTVLDGFQKAYSVDLGPVNLVRAAAFHGAQFIAPLKRNIISYAMGEQKWPFFP